VRIVTLAKLHRDQREGEGRGKWHVEWFSQVVEECVGNGGGEVGVSVTNP